MDLVIWIMNVLLYVYRISSIIFSMKLCIPTSRIALNMGDIPITVSHPGSIAGLWNGLVKHLQPKTSSIREEVVSCRGSENCNIIVGLRMVT